MRRSRRIQPARATHAALIVGGLVLLLIALSPACSGWAPPPAVTIAGDASNRIAPALVAVETAQGDAEIAAGRDPLVTVEPKWAPFWTAWRVWVAAQRAWAQAYASGDPAVAQLEAAAHAAFCRAADMLPASVPPTVIAIDVMACAAMGPADAGAEGGR